jgi:hypothetical protein
VFGSDIIVSEISRADHCLLEHMLCPRCVWQILKSHGGRATLDNSENAGSQRCRLDMESFEHTRGVSGVYVNQSKQDVLRANVFAAEQSSFFTRP